MSADKLSPDAIAILELEGLGPALNEVAALLIGHGLKKHGHQKWTALTSDELQEKARRHLARHDRDLSSGKHHVVHGAARSLMLVAKQLEDA